MNNAEVDLTRRGLVKGAAWAVPVVALAAAAPAASASEKWDVRVQGHCSGQVNLNVLNIAPNLIDTILGLVGLTRAERYFDITASEGTVPSGTQFVINGGGLLNLGLLSVTGALNINALNIIRLGTGEVQITLKQALTQGQSFRINLLSGLASADVASVITLQLVGTDNPTSLPGQPNQAQVQTTIGTSVNLPIVNVSAAVQVCA